MGLIDRDLFRRVEFELYNYQANARKLRERQEEILYSTPYPSEGRSEGSVSDPTMARGLRLARLNESEQAQWVQCIKDALQLMPPEYRDLVRYKYVDGLKVEEIADRLHISRAWYFVWRENVVLYIIVLATQRGLIKPIDESAVS